MKKIIALMLALVALLSFVSCGQKPYESTAKSFSANGMTIKLTEAFKSVSMAGYAAVYEASETVVYVSNQQMSEFDKVKEMSLEKYVGFFRDSNKSKTPSETKTDGDVIYIEYSSTGEGNVVYKYLTAFFEGNGVYVRVEFVAEDKNYEEYRPYFINWAKTVTFA